MRNIKEIINNKTVIFFGTGSLSIKIEKLLQSHMIYPDFYIDNNDSLWGQEIRKRKVLSPRKIVNIQNPFILITSSYEEEIKEQLNNMEFKENMHYFSYSKLFIWCNEIYINLNNNTCPKPNKFISVVEYVCKNSRNITLEYFNLDQRIKYNVPNAMGERFHWKFNKKSKLKIFDTVYIAKLKNGSIWGKNGSVITDDNLLLWDVSRQLARKPENYDIFSKESLPESIKYSGSIGVTATQGGDNYYHWMFEELPRI